MNFNYPLIHALLLSGLLASFGCGTAVDDQPDEVSDEQIKIGILAPITGPLAGFGQDMVATARLAADEIKRNGGVNGKEIGFIIRDSHLGREDSTSVSLAMTQELIDAGSIAIIGPAGSGTLVNIAPLAVAQGVPLISPSATSPAISSLDDADLVWRTIASDAFQGVFLSQQLLQNQTQTIKVLYRDDAYGTGLSQSLIDSFTSLGGRVISTVSYSADKTTNFDGEVSQILAGERSDAIVLISFVIDGASILVSMANANPNPMPKLYGVDGNKRQDLLDNAPRQVLLGMQGSSPTPPLSSANYQAFSETYQYYFHTEPPVFSDSTYDAVYLLALAMDVAGENTTAAIRDNLRSVSRGDTETPYIVNVGPQGYQDALQNLNRDLDLEGAAGSINFDENGDVTSGNYAFWEIVDENGVLVFKTIREATLP